MDHALLFKRACTVIPGGVNSPVRAFNGVGGTPVFAGEAHVVGVGDGCSFDVGCNMGTKGDER